MENIFQEVEGKDQLFFDCAKNAEAAQKAFNEKISLLSNSFCLNIDTFNRLLGIDTDNKIGIDPEKAILHLNGFCYVDLHCVPQGIVTAAVFMPEAYFLKNRYIPLWGLEAAMKVFLKQKATNTQTIGKNMKTYVMFDEASGLVKIGKALNPKVREETLLGNIPMIRLVHVFPVNIETRLHRHFAAYRKRGEWFAVSQKEVIDAGTSILAAIQE